MLVITLGYPVLLDVEGSSLTQGVLNFFRRKLKNCIKIALTVKVELPSHYWYTPYGRGIPNISFIVDTLFTALLFLLSNKTKLNTWSLHSESLCKSILEQKIEFHLKKLISLALFLTKSRFQVWIQAVFWKKVTGHWIRFCSIVGKIELYQKIWKNALLSVLY